ncbi:MAG: hypothetical protein ACTSVV_12275 [Promethearchaeota archaeon]
MKRKRITIITFILIISQIFILTPTVVLAEIDVQELSSNCSEINAKIQEKLFKDEVSGGLEGIGDDEGNKVPWNSLTETMVIENSIATAAFYTRYSRSGNAECDSWATDETFPAIKDSENNNMLERAGTGLFYTVDQAIALEFLSVGYDRSQDQDMLPIMENVYSSLDNFEANTTDGYYGYNNAYWKIINVDGVKYGNDNSNSKYCFTNVSLWVIIGMLKFGLSVKGLSIDIDEEYSTTSVDQAEKIIEFCEDHAFYNGSGFLEYPYADIVNPSQENYYFNTQVLAILAYTRLYEATKTQAYYDKAEMMVKYIITKNFLDTGKTGGCVSYYSQSTGEKSDIKYGFDNALYAYALINLYVAGGESDYSYLRRAEEIVKFMNDNLYEESKDGQIVGYVEKLVNNSIPDGYEIRLWRTNALMMLVNEEIQWYDRPWYIKYMWWLIIGGIIIVAIIVIVVLVKRKRNIGTKLPKMVKGLIED